MWTARLPLNLTPMFFALALTVGCSSSSDQPEIAYVAGTVTLDFLPLDGALIVFTPEEGRSSFAYTDEVGHYELTYLTDAPGATIGKHSVAISTPMEDDDDPEAEVVVETIPPMYNTKTKLSAFVESGRDNEFNFELRSP